ncbi:hypothetical protein NA78x_001720 [Anatilimnocola sp. NA78]|uniref:hypothetical protein n=1 Tax=Anatilimnocola sp. NA78 TaxID=3415683 RepID=UPI003CE4FC6B
MPAIRWGEMPGSGNMTDSPPTREKRYWISGTANDNFAIQVARNIAPPTVASPFGLLYRQHVHTDWTAAAYCIATIFYDAFESINVRFATGGGSVHITNSLFTVNRYARPGDPAAPDLKGAIGYNHNELEGTDVVVPATRFTVEFKHPPGAIGMRSVRRMAGKTAYINSDKWMEHMPGEVLFLGGAGSWGRDTETIVAYDFASSENADGISSPKLNFGDIANVVKLGHDYCWIRYEDNADAGQPTRIPKHAYVERVYKAMPFGQFFSFGQMVQ